MCVVLFCDLFKIIKFSMMFLLFIINILNSSFCQHSESTTHYFSFIHNLLFFKPGVFSSSLANVFTNFIMNSISSSGIEPEISSIPSLRYHLLDITSKPNFALCKNKDADQLCSNCTADQRLCFATGIVLFFFFLNQKFKHLGIYRDCTGRFVSDLV